MGRDNLFTFLLAQQLEPRRRDRPNIYDLLQLIANRLDNGILAGAIRLLQALMTEVL